MHDIKKMIKHSFKDSYKPMIVMNGLLLSSFIAIALMILIFNGNFFVTPFGMFVFSASLIIVDVMILVSGIGILYSIYKSINQKLFTDEGYLTFTLPVSVDSLIVSKVVVNLIWILVYGAIMVIGFLLIILAISLKSYVNIFEEFIEMIDFESITGLDILTIISIIFFVLTGIILSLLFVFNILAFVNTGILKKGKNALAIVLYVFGIQIVLDIIMLINQFLSFGIIYDYEKNKYIFSFGDLEYGNYILNFTSFITIIGAIVGLYFLARFLLKKKIELV